MRLSCLALLVQAAVANDADVATQKCLDNQDLECTEECPPRRVYSRACLVSTVPFRTPYSRVKCCLRCCLKYWLKEYGLDRRWAAFRAEQGGAGRIDDVLLGGTLRHGPSGTLPFASRRVSRDKMPWVLERWTAEERAVEAALAPGRSRTPVQVTDRDRSATDLFLWDRKRTVSANGHAGIGRWSPKDAWLELHFGDNCGDFYRGNAFGTYMGLSLASLLRYFLPEVVGNRSLTLVTSSDCNVPLRPGKTSPFLDMNDLLETVNLKAWYANNPSDGLIDSAGEIARPHPKMKAYATGVRDPAQWVEALDGREASTERTGPLVCCCMSMLATPQKASEYAAPREYTSPQQRVRERAKRVFDHDRVLTDEAMRWRYGPNRRGLGETMSRVRRFAVLDELTKNGFDCSDRTARSGDELRELYFGSDFVVSPQGKGRTNYREWEALAAGAIPLVDYDSSAAMAELYQGLPVVRVRDWKKVTPAYLDAVRTRVFDAVAQGGVSMSKLYVPYWLHEFTKSLDDAPAPAAAPPRQQPTCAIVVGNDPITRIQRINTYDRVYREPTYSGNGKWTHAAVAFKGEDCPARRFAAAAPAHVEAVSTIPLWTDACISRQEAVGKHYRWHFVPRPQARDCEQMMQRRVNRLECPPDILAVVEARRDCREVVVFGRLDGVEGQIVADWEAFGLVTLVSNS